MNLRLSPKNRIIRFAYPFGYSGRYVSLCRLFWKSVFMSALWFGGCFLVAMYVAMWVVYTKDAAIVTGGVITFVGIVGGLTYFSELSHASKRIVYDKLDLVVDSTPVQLIYAGYKGIKERFCPIIVIAEEGDGDENVRM